MIRIVLAAMLMLLFAGCSPAIGSDEWCAKLKDKPNDDWTQMETKEYVKSCIFDFGDKQ